MLCRERNYLLPRAGERIVCQDNYGLGTGSLHGYEGSGEFGRFAHHEQLRLHPERPSRRLCILPRILVEGVRCIAKDGETGHCWQGSLKHLHTFAAELGPVHGHARDITARMGEAGDDPGPQRVAGRHHDRNRHCSSFRRDSWRRANGDDRVGAERYELSRKHVEGFTAKSVLDFEIPALDVAQIVKTGL
jgi:hypothetical protein